MLYQIHNKLLNCIINLIEKMRGIITFIFLFFACATTDLRAQCDREQMVLDYNANYLGSNVTVEELGWTGNVSTCNAGKISRLAQTRTLQRINYFRHLAGLPNAIALDSIKNRNCQEAALMMDANNDIDHSPPTSWSCYSVDGAKAARSSNLAYGPHSSAAITLFMDDEGSPNLGHRRWILQQSKSIFGHGATPTISVLYVFDDSGTSPNLPFTAYPCPGFFPAPLASVKTWSFSIPSADFSLATVSITSPNGELIPVTSQITNNGYGDNTIAFDPIGIIVSSIYDETYTVTINNVKLSTGTVEKYTYKVTIAQITYPPACPKGKVWVEKKCECVTP
jgi:uncharacterized protein YkwD